MILIIVFLITKALSDNPVNSIDPVFVVFVVFVKLVVFESLILFLCLSFSLSKLGLYKFSADNSIIGISQLNSLIEEDETISAELDSLNVSGVKMVFSLDYVFPVFVFWSCGIVCEFFHILSPFYLLWCFSLFQLFYIGIIDDIIVLQICLKIYRFD